MLQEQVAGSSFLLGRTLGQMKVQSAVVGAELRAEQVQLREVPHVSYGLRGTCLPCCLLCRCAHMAPVSITLCKPGSVRLPPSPVPLYGVSLQRSRSLLRVPTLHILKHCRRCASLLESHWCSPGVYA